MARSSRKPPVFLAPASYRQRRLQDAARVLPFAGAILFMLPLLWLSGSETQSTSTVLLYIFSVWVILIVGVFAISRRIRPGTENETAEHTRSVEEGP